MRLTRCILGMLLLAGGCGSDGEAPPRGGEPEATPASGETYRSSPGFPLPFHTALPEGFLAQEQVDGDGAAVRFVWARGAEHDSAFVYVRVMDEGTSEGAAREIVRTAAERLRVPGDRSELDPREGRSWAVVEYPLESVGSFGEPVQGWVALGHRRGRWFYVVTQAPVNGWLRFEPRAERILSAWQWTGAGAERLQGP